MAQPATTDMTPRNHQAKDDDNVQSWTSSKHKQILPTTPIGKGINSKLNLFIDK